MVSISIPGDHKYPRNKNLEFFLSNRPGDFLKNRNNLFHVFHLIHMISKLVQGLPYKQAVNDI